MHASVFTKGRVAKSAEILRTARTTYLHSDTFILALFLVESIRRVEHRLCLLLAEPTALSQGIIITLGSVFLLIYAFLPGREDINKIIDQYAVAPIFRCSGLFVLYLWLYGCDLFVWTASNVEALSLTWSR